MESKIFTVPGMHCDHCKAAVARELEAVHGVRAIEIDLDTKLVTVGGDDLDHVALIAAIDEAGYEATELAAR